MNTVWGLTHQWMVIQFTEIQNTGWAQTHIPTGLTKCVGALHNSSFQSVIDEVYKLASLSASKNH